MLAIAAPAAQSEKAFLYIWNSYMKTADFLQVTLKLSINPRKIYLSTDPWERGGVLQCFWVIDKVGGMGG